jgi:leucyl aminopeptidase
MTKITSSNKALKAADKKYCRVVLTEDKPSWHRLVETKSGGLEYRMGAGKNKEMNVRSFRTLVRSIVQAAKSHQIEYIALELNLSDYPTLQEKGSEWFYQTIGANLSLASYEFTKYKTKKESKKQLKEVLVCGVSSQAEKQSFSAGITIATATNTARDISNTTGDHLTPSEFGIEAKNAFKGTDVTVKVLDEKQIKQLKMGLLTEVGKGAHDRERFIIIEYWGLKKPTAKTSAKADSSLNPIILVGKGVTYDTGGLNVKPSGFMHDMHLDMSGGASVVGAILASAKLGLKKNVVGLIPVAENAVSSTSMRAGDIATSMSGQTVEILHTDAEGRLILADALTYAQQNYQPKCMVDIATLTGAALVALGQHSSAVLTKDEKLREQIVTLGEETGDLMWPLPLWEEYKQYLKSTRADISNIATSFSRFGGTIEGGTFLSFFVDKKIPWAHLDIAPRMSSIPSDKLAKGSTGEPVQLLVALIKNS